MDLKLETERLILRTFEPRDVPAFAAYRSDPEVARYQGWSAPYSEEQAAAFVRAVRRVKPGAPGKWLQLAIQVKAGGGLAGAAAAPPSTMVLLLSESDTCRAAAQGLSRWANR